MSAYERKRGKSKIDFYDKVNKLVDAVQDVVENPKWYPKRQTFRRSIPLMELSNRLAEVVCIANSNFPTCWEDYVERRKSQTLAIGLAEALLQQFQRDCLKLRTIPSSQKKRITGIAIDTRDQLKAWRTSDKQRFEKKFKHEQDDE